MDINASTFGRNLKRAREKAQMTQPDLLSRLLEMGYPLTQPALSHYEQGRRFPDPPVMAAMAQILEVSVDHLLGLTEITSPVSEILEDLAAASGEGRINKIIKRLPKSKQEQIVNFAEFLLYIRHGKGNKARYVTLGTRTAKAIWLYMTKREKPRPTDPLFAAKTGRFLQRDNLRHTLEKIGDNAGVENVYPHRFRHTFAIEFLRNGGNVMLLKELLGHESLDMVMRYAKISEQDIRNAPAHSPADNWRL